jgi:SAM-dependent methyltransferase
MSLEEQFYKRHYVKRRLGNISGPETFGHAFTKPGHRYYCVHDQIEDGRSLRALEWGFGDLRHCQFFGSYFREFHAVDIAANLLIQQSDLTERELNFSFLEHNLNCELPYADETFNVLIAMMVIEHLFDPFQSFRELARLTRKSGVAFVNLPLITSVKNRLRLLIGQLPKTSANDWWELEEWDGGHLHLFSIGSVARLAEKYGLKLRALYPVGRAWKVKRLWPSGLCNEISFVFEKK